MFETGFYFAGRMGEKDKKARILLLLAEESLRGWSKGAVPKAEARSSVPIGKSRGPNITTGRSNLCCGSNSHVFIDQLV